MTFLTLCQNVADETGVQRPAAVIGSTDAGLLKIRRAANKAGISVMRAAKWLVLRKEKTFTAIAGETQTGILPADFDRFVPETFWDRTNIQLLIGPTSPVEWNGLKAGGYDGVSRRFIHRGTAILIIPVFDGGQSLAFEYISRNWCQSSTATAQYEWAADTDTGILDEELLTLATTYFYKDSEGLPADSARADFVTAFNALLDNETPDPDVMMAGDIFGGGRRFAGAPSSGNDVGGFA